MNQTHPLPHSKAPNGQDPSLQLEKQTCGYVIAILFSMGNILGVLLSMSVFFLHKGLTAKLMVASYGLSNISWAYFFIKALNPEYLAGKPAFINFVPAVLGGVFLCTGSILDRIEKGQPVLNMVGSFFGCTVIVVVLYFMYMLDDQSGNCCLCFKPFIYKRALVMYAPSYGYPPQGPQGLQVYPPQGYPPQAYPPQAYPPQAPQGYPPQAPQATQGYPPQAPQANPPQQKTQN